MGAASSEPGTVASDGSDMPSRLEEALLVRVAGRQRRAIASMLAGIVLVGYAHWAGPGQWLVPWFVGGRLLMMMVQLLVSRTIVTRHARGESIKQLEWLFVVATGAGSAFWGLIAWMVPDLNYVAWTTLDVLSAVALVFISSMTLITLAHHRAAMVTSLCAQWLVSCGHMLHAPSQMRETTLIFIGIMTLLSVMLAYGGMLYAQTREGVLAELRNEDLTERLWRSNAELERALSQAVEAASQDALTGVFNRRALYARADYLAAARKRQGWPGVALLLDIDHFKSINDSFGHAAGDLVLVEVAAALRTELREMDVVARWGGEEFLVLMPDCDLGTALQRAEDLRASVARLRVHGLPPGRSVRVSIGVADWPAGDELDAVIARADGALYRAKQGGRDRVMLAV